MPLATDGSGDETRRTERTHGGPRRPPLWDGAGPVRRRTAGRVRRLLAGRTARPDHRSARYVPDHRWPRPLTTPIRSCVRSSPTPALLLPGLTPSSVERRPRRGQRERALVERTADDDGGRTRVPERADVVERGDAAARDDRDVDRLDHSTDRLRLDAVHASLHVDVGEQDGAGTEVLVARRRLRRVEAGLLGPAGDDHLAVLRVEAHHHGTGMLRTDVGDDVGVLDRRGAEDDAVDAAVEQRRGVVDGPDAAAELHLDVDGVADRFDRRRVRGRAGGASRHPGPPSVAPPRRGRRSASRSLSRPAPVGRPRRPARPPPGRPRTPGTYLSLGAPSSKSIESASFKML